MITIAFGEYFAIPLMTSFVMFALIIRRSSRLIPGSLGLPAVTTTTSQSTRSDISSATLTTVWLRTADAA